MDVMSAIIIGLKWSLMVKLVVHEKKYPKLEINTKKV